MIYKRMAAYCLTAIMVLSLAGCGGEKDEEKPKIEAVPTPTETTADTTETVADTTETQTDDESSFVGTIIMPEGFYLNSEGEWVQGEESSVSESKAPAQQTIKISTNWTDLEFVFDNTLIKCDETKFGVIMDKGWYHAPEDNFYGFTYTDFGIGKEPYYYIRPNSSHSSLDHVATVDLYNPDGGELPYNDLLIEGFMYDATESYLSEQDCCNVYISNGITFGTSVNDVFNSLGQPDKTEQLESFVYEPDTNYSMDSKVVTHDYTTYDKTKVTYISNDRELTFIIADNKVTGIGMKKVIENY